MWIFQKWGDRRPGIFLGVILFLPTMSCLPAYMESAHLNYTPFKLNKVLLLGFLGFLVFHFPYTFPKRIWQFLIIFLVLILSIWTHAAGFSAWALVLGISVLLFWRHFSVFNPNIHQTIAAMMIVSVMVLPTLSSDLAIWLRNISILSVDWIMNHTPIHYQRTGISYFVGEQQISILEKCSGSAITRVFMVLFASFYFYRRKFAKAWMAAPLLAIILGVFCNTLRIITHILLSLFFEKPLDQTIHEAIGILLFIITIFLFLVLQNKGRTPFQFFPDKVSYCVPPNKTNSAILCCYLITGLTGALATIHLSASKHMEHEYRIAFMSQLEKVHVNHFTEYQGGGGWILLEHPIEQCLAFQGWDLDDKQMTYNRHGGKIYLKATYRIGNHVFNGRWKAAFQKWADLFLWSAPIHAEISIIETRHQR